MIRLYKSFCKLRKLLGINIFQVRLLHFLFTIPHELVFKDFAYFLRIANLRKNSLLILVRTMYMTCTIPCQRLSVPNLTFIGAGLGRSFEEKSCYV